MKKNKEYEENIKNFKKFLKTLKVQFPVKENYFKVSVYNALFEEGVYYIFLMWNDSTSGDNSVGVYFYSDNTIKIKGDTNATSLDELKEYLKDKEIVFDKFH